MKQFSQVSLTRSYILATVFVLLMINVSSLKTQTPTMSHTSQLPYTQKNASETLDPKIRNTVLLVLTKLSITPSYSLCLELGMQRCDKQCCQSLNVQSHELGNWHRSRHAAKKYSKSRKFTEDSKDVTQKKNQTNTFNQSQLCGLTNRTMCGKSCCISDGCDPQTVNNKTQNLKTEDAKCLIPDPSSELLCRGVGLLWCDGQCCGFNSATHKCFTKNHFGIPYIRCPIQAEPIIIFTNSSETSAQSLEQDGSQEQ